MKYGMKIFGALMIAHWLEHIFQAYQVYVLHMNRMCALGMLGMKYPWLVRTESLHFVFAWLTFVMFYFAGIGYFSSQSAIKLWILGWAASFFHLVEHSLLFAQAVTHHYMFGATQPTSLLQQFFPRIELHLFYNSIITLLMILSLEQEHSYREIKKFKRDHQEHCELCR